MEQRAKSAPIAIIMMCSRQKRCESMRAIDAGHQMPVSRGDMNDCISIACSPFKGILRGPCIVRDQVVATIDAYAVRSHDSRGQTNDRCAD